MTIGQIAGFCFGSGVMFGLVIGLELARRAYRDCAKQMHDACQLLGRYDAE